MYIYYFFIFLYLYLVYYSSDQVTTRDGKLTITTTNEPYTWKGYNQDTKQWDTFTRYYRSGMLQGTMKLKTKLYK